MRSDQSVSFDKTPIENACQISLRGNLLRRNGAARSLAAAEAHNRRKIPVELDSFAHIDPSRSALNHELISLNEISLEDTILEVLHKRGVDLKASHK